MAVIGMKLRSHCLAYQSQERDTKQAREEMGTVLIITDYPDENRTVPMYIHDLMSF